MAERRRFVEESGDSLPDVVPDRADRIHARAGGSQSHGLHRKPQQAAYNSCTARYAAEAADRRFGARRMRGGYRGQSGRREC